MTEAQDINNRYLSISKCLSLLQDTENTLNYMIETISALQGDTFENLEHLSSLSSEGGREVRKEWASINSSHLTVPVCSRTTEHHAVRLWHKKAGFVAGCGKNIQ